MDFAMPNVHMYVQCGVLLPTHDRKLLTAAEISFVNRLNVLVPVSGSLMFYWRLALLSKTQTNQQASLLLRHTQK